MSARARLRGPLHWNYGKKRLRPKTGPRKLRARSSEIKARIAAGETMAALAKEFAVNYKTIDAIKRFDGFAMKPETPEPRASTASQ